MSTKLRYSQLSCRPKGMLFLKVPLTVSVSQNQQDVFPKIIRWPCKFSRNSCKISTYLNQDFSTVLQHFLLKFFQNIVWLCSLLKSSLFFLKISTKNELILSILHAEFVQNEVLNLGHPITKVLLILGNTPCWFWDTDTVVPVEHLNEFWALLLEQPYSKTCEKVPSH